MTEKNNYKACCCFLASQNCLDCCVNGTCRIKHSICLYWFECKFTNNSYCSQKALFLAPTAMKSVEFLPQLYWEQEEVFSIEA